MRRLRRAGPAGPKWISQRWEDVLFLHWGVDAGRLRQASHLPPGAELDVREGRGWLTVVLLTSSRTGLGGVRPMPAFHQVNVRTYVRAGGTPGLWFLYIGAGAWPLAPVMSWAYGISARPVWMQHERKGAVLESTVRGALGQRLLSARFGVSAPSRVVEELLETGSGLEAWLLDRFTAFGKTAGQLIRADVEHPPWEVGSAEGELGYQALLKHLDVPVPPRPDLAHFAPRVDVRLSIPRRHAAIAPPPPARRRPSPARPRDERPPAQPSA